MAKLVEKNAGAWACSECGKEIPVTPRGPTTEEKGDLHVLAFDQHVAEAHKKSRRNEPRLIDYQGAQRCSICKMPFPDDVKPSMSVAFAEHLRKAHKPGQTSEDFSQAAARVVKEATDKV